jgi:hypothetical protein
VVTTTLLLPANGAASTQTPGSASFAMVSATGADTASAAGTSSWRLKQPATNAEIEGYSLAASGLPGVPVALAVSTKDPSYQVTAYRFGDYQGGQARLIWSSSSQTGIKQAAPSLSPYETRTVVADWTPTTVVATDYWKPGAYLFKLTSSSGYESWVPYVVRSRYTTGTVALVAPVTTWQAYNTWGGYSLYVGPTGDQRSWAVSFDRPYRAPGAADFIYGVKPVVLLAERLGLPLSYLANTDVAADPSVLNGARAYVSMGHDEYWTREMRQAVTTARDAGTNLAFLGANTMYWQIRLDTTDTERPDRVVIGYRTDAKLDPLYYSHPELVTGRWRDAPSPEPENALIGMQYECHPVDTDYVVATPEWWGFDNTGVVQGSRFAHLVGVEADRVYPIDSTPRPLQILSYATYSCLGVQTSTESTYYTTPSGAGIFAAGTLRWTCAIYQPCGAASLSHATNVFVRHVTARILRVFAKGPAAVTYPAHDNVADFPLPPDNQVPAS